MKKRDILRLIELNSLEENSLLGITKDSYNPRIRINREFWFPNNPDLKDEFSVLSLEVDEALLEEKQVKEDVKKISCSHEVRLRYYSTFSSSSTCVLCKRHFSGDNVISWDEETYRNKGCAILDAKYQDNPDMDNDFIKDGYTSEDLINLIKDILEDKDLLEEVSLVEEFKKLNLNNCDINDEKKYLDNYVLVVGGTNKKYIDDSSYLFRNTLKNGKEFIKYFSELLHVKVLGLDNDYNDPKIISGRVDSDNYAIKYMSYDTLEELYCALDRNRDIPFRLVIDLTELYDYNVSDNSIIMNPILINFNEYFPDCKVVRIKNVSRVKDSDLDLSLKSDSFYSMIYGSTKDKMFYLDKDGVKSCSIEDGCNSIKRLLKRR